jgi:hypothetical protein
MNIVTQKIPNVFIVGAPKCGTSALSQYLGEHPDIFMAQKEMHFFGGDLSFGPQFYRRNRAAYLAEFGGWNSQACAGEASVWYLFSRQAAAEIKAFNPEARLIILLREPVSMLYSLYHQFRGDGNENLPTFEEALAAEADREAGRRIGRQTYFRQGLAYRATAAYTEQVRRYFDVFGRERVQVILYDDFVADTARAYRETLEFLGLPSDNVRVDFRVINGNKSSRSSLLGAFLNDPLVRGTAISLRAKLPRAVFTLMQKAGSGLCNFNQRTEKRAPLSPDVDQSLRREFAPEVERLSELLQRDLTQWSRGAVPAAVPPPPLSAAQNRTVNPQPEQFNQRFESRG